MVTIHEEATMFDWIANWHLVEPVIALPAVRDALDFLMIPYCQNKGEKWDRTKWPEFYSSMAAPEQFSADQPIDCYRCWGECHTYQHLGRRHRRASFSIP